MTRFSFFCAIVFSVPFPFSFLLFFFSPKQWCVDFDQQKKFLCRCPRSQKEMFERKEKKKKFSIIITTRCSLCLFTRFQLSFDKICGIIV